MEQSKTLNSKNKKVVKKASTVDAKAKSEAPVEEKSSDVIRVYTEKDKTLNAPVIESYDYSGCEKASDYVSVFIQNSIKPRSRTFINKNNGEAFVTLADKANVFETYAIESKSFREMLQLEADDEFVRPLPGAVFSPHVEVMAARARKRNVEKKVYLRIGIDSKTNKIYYNLANKKHEFVRIASDQVKIIPSNLLGYRLPFITTKAMTEQVLPALNGNGKNLVELLKPFFPLKHKEQLLLLAITLVCWFIPNIPKPLLLFTGEKGNGKTLACSTVQTIVDPTRHANFNVTKKRSDLYAILKSHYCSLLDNISKLSEEMSDTVATAITRASSGGRQLYTDNELHYENFDYCAIILAGINNFIFREDLMSRVVHLPLKLENAGKNRVTEAYLKNKLANDLPYILHEIFITLQKAMKIRESYTNEDVAKMEFNDRLADYELFARCVSKVMFDDEEVFIKLYRDTMNRQVTELLLNNKTISITYEYLQSRSPVQKWPIKMQPKEFFLEVRNYGVQQGYLTSDYDTSFAQGVAVFGKTISAESTQDNPQYNEKMLKLGYRITTKSGTRRTIIIEKV